MIHRKNEAGEKEIFNRGYYSSVLDKHRKNLLPCEGEAIGMKLVLEHFLSLIRESNNVTSDPRRQFTLGRIRTQYPAYHRKKANFFHKTHSRYQSRL